jgi:hypothetical protein
MVLLSIWKILEGYNNFLFAVARRRVARGDSASVRQQAGPTQRHDRQRANRQAGPPVPQKQKGKLFLIL